MPATTAANASSNQKWFPVPSFNLRRFSRPSQLRQHAATASGLMLESSPALTHDHDHGSLGQQLSKKFNKSVNMITSLLVTVNHERAANKALKNLMDQTIRQKEEEIAAGNTAFEELADLLKIKEAEAAELTMKNFILKTQLEGSILNEVNSNNKATNEINNLTRIVDILKQELANADKKHEDTVILLNQAEKMSAKAAKKSHSFKCFLERELTSEKTNVHYLLNETIKARLQLWELMQEKDIHQQQKRESQLSNEIIDDCLSIPSVSSTSGQNTTAKASQLLVAAIPRDVLNKNISNSSLQPNSTHSKLSADNNPVPKISQPLVAQLPGDLLYRRICEIDHIINKSTTFEKSEYKIINKLGSGGCGQVFLASNSNNTKKFAVKTSCIQRAQLIHCFLSEVKILTAAKHPNIVEMVDVFVGEAPQTYHVVLELMHVTCGDLFDLKGRNSAMQCSVMVVLMRQVLAALEHLHDEVNVIHRDVKGDNILLLRNGIVKLADFGMSAFCPDVVGKNIVQGFKRYCGTEAFMAPELLERKEYGTAVDIYATGRVFGHLMGQVHPRGQCQHGAHDIIKHMLNHNPISRPTASQALEHAAFVNASSRIPVATYLFRNFPAVQK